MDLSFPPPLRLAVERFCECKCKIKRVLEMKSIVVKKRVKTSIRFSQLPSREELVDYGSQHRSITLFIFLFRIDFAIKQPCLTERSPRPLCSFFWQAVAEGIRLLFGSFILVYCVPVPFITHHRFINSDSFISPFEHSISDFFSQFFLQRPGIIFNCHSAVKLCSQTLRKSSIRLEKTLNSFLRHCRITHHAPGSHCHSFAIY